MLQVGATGINQRTNQPTIQLQLVSLTQMEYIIINIILVPKRHDGVHRKFRQSSIHCSHKYDMQMGGQFHGLDDQINPDTRRVDMP
jgi:hypothetical protein